MGIFWKCCGSLSGVAIAVALVPPLCVSGIGLGWLNFEIFYGAMLLSVLMVAVISFPLFFSFLDMQKMAEIKSRLLSQNYEISGQVLQLRNIKIQSGTPLRLNADLISRRMPNPQILTLFEQHLSDQLKQPVTVDFSVHMVTEGHF